ncbi:protein B4 isoform X3 [Micropterus dolomieu]|nr:protein B4 isoform X3 [Micropterus dolomieu]
MVKEALKELDSRKGVSSQAIQNYIKQKYPSVDLVRLKHLVRRALKKGIETGTLVRPANSSVTTGAMGKFRLAPKVKDAKTENTDPNVQKVPKAAKDGAKKPQKTGATKKKDAAKDQAKSDEDPKPPKKSKKDKGATTSTKVAPAKKPKAKKAAEKGEDEGASDSAKTKAAKTTKAAKAEKPEKVPKSKAAKAHGDAPASKATKRGKKDAE